MSVSVKHLIHKLDLEDFDATIIRVTFLPDESSATNEHVARIPLVDDDINEATEQVFVVKLYLRTSLNPSKISVTKRPVSLCRIIDDDGK